MNRLNYCSQAIEGLAKLTYGKADIAASARDTMTLLQRAEKFVLPNWGRVFSKEEWKLVQDVRYPTRLPYPVIALEYHCPYTMGNSKMAKHEVPSSKRIAIAAEYEALISLVPECIGKIAETNPTASKLGYFILPVFSEDEERIWTPPPAAMFMPRGGNESLSIKGSKDGVVLDFLSNHLAVLPLGKAAYESYPIAERPTRAARDVADEALAVCHLMTALSLDKGRHVTLPAPEKLNRKRAKKGRPPLYEYKMLDIVADVMSPPTEGVSHGKGSHHASPRMHSRRGHVRKLASGKTTWIRNSIIGKPGRGEIIKDYAVHH